MTKTLSVRLPFFPGFYESEALYQFDSLIEQDCEYLEHDCSASQENLERYSDAMLEHVSWSVCFEAYARSFTEGLQNVLTPGVLWKFTELYQPREYNFATDAIFAEIPLAALRAMRSLSTTQTQLETLILEQYTSYGGFQSYYPNNLAEWPNDIACWKPCQLGTLVEAYALGAFNKDDLEIDNLMEYSDVMSCFHKGWKPPLTNLWDELTKQIRTNK